MFWPKNQKKYENLKSSFVNLQGLVEDLGETGFSGFLEVIFENECYYILKEPGRLEKIYIKGSRGGFIPAELTLDEIQEKSLEDLSIINVFDVDPNRLGFILGCLSAVPLYSNLSSEFTDFEKLLNKLSKDGHSGYLEIFFQNSSIEPAYLLYRNGKIEEAFWGERQLEKGDEDINEINLKLRGNEALFNVYQILEKAEAFVRNSLEQEEIKGHETPEIESSELLMESVEIGKEVQGRPAERVQSNTQAVAAESIEPRGSGENLQEATIEKSKNELENLSIFPYLDFTEALIQWVEKAVNQNMGKNYFSKAFKKGLLNISDKYSFLDPFLAEFTYMDGKVNFTSEAKAIDFLKGIYAAIDTLFEELTEKERANVQRNLKQTLQDLEKEHHENIEILRVRTLMPTLFQ